MKYLFILAALFSGAGAVQAQQLSLGVRTGASYWMENSFNQEPRTTNGNFGWDQEVFTRYELKKRWAFEVGLLHNNQSSSYYQTDGQYGPVSYASRAKDYYYGLEVTAQYDISCHWMQQCPFFKHLKSYIGVTVQPTLDHTSEFITESQYPGVEMNFVNNEINIWTGVSHTLMYAINKNWSVTSVASFKLNTKNFFSDSWGLDGGNPSANLSLRLGIAYRLR